MIRAAARRAASVAMAAGLAVALAGVARAECLQADAYYADLDRNAVIAFDEGFAAAPGLSNRFSMLIGDVALDGVVTWSGGVERPQAILLHNCPEGDATGAEIEACTLWQGIVYAIDNGGEVGLLPSATSIAADRLLFPGLPWHLSFSEAHETGEMPELPFEVFELTGCAQ